MNTCNKCGASMIQLFTSMVCSQECDLAPTVTQDTDWAIAQMRLGNTVRLIDRDPNVVILFRLSPVRWVEINHNVTMPPEIWVKVCHIDEWVLDRRIPISATWELESR